MGSILLIKKFFGISPTDRIFYSVVFFRSLAGFIPIAFAVLGVKQKGLIASASWVGFAAALFFLVCFLYPKIIRVSFLTLSLLSIFLPLLGFYFVLNSQYEFLYATLFCIMIGLGASKSETLAILLVLPQVSAKDNKMLAKIHSYKGYGMIMGTILGGLIMTSLGAISITMGVGVVSLCVSALGILGLFSTTPVIDNINPPLELKLLRNIPGLLPVLVERMILSFTLGSTSFLLTKFGENELLPVLAIILYMGFYIFSLKKLRFMGEHGRALKSVFISLFIYLVFASGYFMVWTSSLSLKIHYAILICAFLGVANGLLNVSAQSLYYAKERRAVQRNAREVAFQLVMSAIGVGCGIMSVALLRSFFQ